MNAFFLINTYVKEFFSGGSGEELENGAGGVYERGGCFGEVALVTETPYASSVSSVAPSSLLVIDKRTFHHAMEHDKTKLAEIKIRLSGSNAELDAILEHNIGYDLFMSFLEKEHCSENL